MILENIFIFYMKGFWFDFYLFGNLSLVLVIYFFISILVVKIIIYREFLVIVYG